MTARAVRIVVASLATAAALGVGAPAPARAGTYELLACDAAPDHSFYAWQREAPTSNGTMAAYASWCDGNAGRVNDMETNGLISRADYDNRWTAWHEGQGWRMRPAPGTKVLGMTWAGTLRRPSTLAGTEGWAARIADSGNGATYLSCPASTGSCTYNQTTPQWMPLPSGAPGAGIQVGSYCVPAIPQSCLNAWTSPYFNTASAALARVRYADVRVQDETLPAVSITGGGLTSAGWLRGDQAVSYASSDNSGVRVNRLYVDGTQQGDDTPRACDFTDSVPCPESASGTYAVATDTLADGTHTARVEAVDPAGNAAVATATFKTDNTPPATSVLGAGTPGIVSDGPLDITMLGIDQPGLSGMGGADPGDPVSAGGHVDYSVDGGPTAQVRGDEAHVRLAAEGPHTIEVRAYDVAQNASPEQTVHVTIGAPAQPKPRAHAGFWDETASTATFAAAPSFATSCPQEATLTPSAAATVDQGDPTRALGAQTTVTVRSHAGRNARALLAFDLPALGDCAVLSARLRVRRQGDRPLAVYRLASEWSASSVTWDSRPGAAGSPATGTDSFEVTEQVRGLYRAGNQGLVVEDAAEGDAEAHEETLTAPELVVTLG